MKPIFAALLAMSLLLCATTTAFAKGKSAASHRSSGKSSSGHHRSKKG